VNISIVNYEQILADALDVNLRLRPDVVVLDEAQRIKNWSTKTAQAVKRLRSRYAFVLTGTPIENRIDELRSLMDFLNPSVLGPLFRFNREFYELDERGRPAGHRNLDQLHARIKPYMVRRRKAEVETEWPERTERNHFVPLSDEQKNAYSDHEKQGLSNERPAAVRPTRPLPRFAVCVAIRRASCGGQTGYYLRIVCVKASTNSPSSAWRADCRLCASFRAFGRVSHALLLRCGQGLGCDQQALAFVALAGAAESHDHGRERTLFAGAPREGHVSRRQEHPMVEVGATQAERLAFFHEQEVALQQLRAAFGAVAIRAHLLEHDQVRRLAQLRAELFGFLF